MKKRIAAVALAGLLAQPALAQSQPNLLGELVKAITKKKSDNGASARGTTPQTGGAGTFVVAMSPEQQADLQKALDAKLPNPDIARDLAEARPLIEDLVRTGACATSAAAWNAFNKRHLTPITFSDAYEGLRAALPHTRYHDRRFCFDVLRVTDWSKPAKNALRFRAQYVSGQSGEAAKQPFELQRSPEGEWLVRDIGYTHGS